MKPINILLILSLLLLGSCVDKDLNNDPTKSANLNPNFQLTGIELRQWGSMDIGSICNRYMSPLTQQMQGNWDATNYGGQYRNDDNQIKSLWNFMYQNQIKNIVDLVSRTDGDAGYANLGVSSSFTMTKSAYLRFSSSFIWLRIRFSINSREEASRRTARKMRTSSGA